MSTATARSTDVRSGLVTLLVVGLYISTIAFPRVIGYGGEARLKLIAEALLFAVVLGCLGFVLLARGQFQLDRAYTGIAAIFGIFLLLSTVALVVGLTRDYPVSDVLGDYYKFIVPIVTITLVYAASESSEQLETAFAVVFRIALLLLTGVLALYVTGILQPNIRPGVIYQYPVVLVLGYWLFRHGDPIAQYGFPLLVLAGLPLAFYSQSLSLLLQTGLTAGFVIVYASADDAESLIARGGVFATAGVVGLGLFLLFALQISAEQWEQYGYLGSKIAALVGDYTLYEQLIALGGSRAAEPFGVLARIDGDLFELLLGSGMGSTFFVSSPFPAAVWVGEDHFVHAGLWEAVLRTGVFGGITYFGVHIAYLYVSWQISSDSYLGALAAANASVVLIFAPVSGKLLGPQFFSYTLFAYALIRWVELRAD